MVAASMVSIRHPSANAVRTSCGATRWVLPDVGSGSSRKQSRKQRPPGLTAACKLSTNASRSSAEAVEDQRGEEYVEGLAEVGQEPGVVAQESRGQAPFFGLLRREFQGPGG